MGLGEKLFGTYSEKQLKKIEKAVNLIEALAPKYAEMSNEELAGTTNVLKERLANGESLDDILPDAFAAIREADDRVLGKRPFRVQLIGGIILHQGRIAEMKTGEGKTLVATMPAYLNALAGKGVHVITVNDYLARRDSEEMGRVYEFMGLTTGLVVHGLSPAQKKESYQADITYGTNNEFGFDYLRDNMVVHKEETVQRGHSFAIVDEVDSILIDEARTPLIISGAGQKSTDMYDRANTFAKGLKKLVIKEADSKKSYDEQGTEGLLESTLERIMTLEEGESFLVLAPVFTEFGGTYEEALSLAKKNQCLGIRVDGTVYGLSETVNLDSEKEHTIEIVVERLKMEPKIKTRLSILVEKAFRLSENNLFIVTEPIEGAPKTFKFISDYDYVVDEKAKNVILTSRGTKRAEKFFNIENLSETQNAEIAHHINQAIRAHGIMKRDVDYVVNEHGVMIVDTFTGRLMPGRRYSNGLHQAIEAKEGITVERENRTLATITFQNYFRMYTKLSGMTGTALTEDAEFREIYGLDVIEIPTNRPMIRKDHHDLVYSTVKGKYKAVVAQVKACHEKGQPVLVGTVSIEKSEELSKCLKMAGIAHTVLNAKHHEKEAEIIAQAGKLGAVTISTNMAGRGTDIMLGGNPEYLAKREMRKMDIDDELIAMATGSAETDDEEVNNARRIFRQLFEKFKEEIAPEAEQVKQAGGLFILGTERHESRRIDNQLRGRAGRQGDPGESRFFIALEDDLMRLFGSNKVMGMMSMMNIPEESPIDAKILSNQIENAQKHLEEQNFKRRKYVLTYDDVMNQQRNIIYEQRNSVLNGDDVSDTIRKMIETTVVENVEHHLSGEDQELWSFSALRELYKGLLTTDEDFVEFESGAKAKKKDISQMLVQRALDLYEEKVKLVGEEVFKELERAVLLKCVDLNWMDHIDAMDELKNTVRLQSYAQRDPVTEYRLQGADMFDAMISEIRETVVRYVLSVTKETVNTERDQVAKPLEAGFEGEGNKPKKVTVRRTSASEPERNGPCPCGSGKKYKKCCGAPGARAN